MIPLAEARSFVLDACTPVAPRPIPIDEALGCVVATPVIATEPVPPFANSSMDGYALRSVDSAPTPTGEGPVRLEVVGTVMAGSVLEAGIGPGQAARIMTGAPLPPGADAVCMLEECVADPDGSGVVIPGPVRAGNFVRRAGQDVDVGETVVAAGTATTAGHLGVLADQGLTHVEAHPRLRIGVLSTGDELTSDPGPLAAGKIRDANRHTLAALVRGEGWDAVDLGVVGDDREALGRLLDEAVTRCDAVVTSGGVSVGDLDVVKVVLEQRSAGTMRWMQVAIRPAKPFAFGLLPPGVPVFGLPGNPVSAMVSFELFVRPAARLMSGHRVIERMTVPATAERAFERRPDGKTHFLRSFVWVDELGSWRARPMDGQESHQLLAMAESNALAVLPDGDGVAAGGNIEIMLTDPGRIGSRQTASQEALR